MTNQKNLIGILTKNQSDLTHYWMMKTHLDRLDLEQTNTTDSTEGMTTEELIHTVLNMFPKSYVEKVTYYVDVEDETKNTQQKD